MSQRIKRARLILAGAVVIAALLLVSDVARGLPLSAWYRSQVSHSFKHDFAAVNARLTADYGVRFDGQKTRTDCWPASGYPNGVKVIFTCDKMQQAVPTVADEPFIRRWRQTSPDLERYLLGESWQKDWNKDQPINEILDNFENRNSIGVNYSKKHGQVTCRLALMWTMPESPNYLRVTEVCEVAQPTWGW